MTKEKKSELTKEIADINDAVLEAYRRFYAIKGDVAELIAGFGNRKMRKYASAIMDEVREGGLPNMFLRTSVDLAILNVFAGDAAECNEDKE